MGPRKHSLARSSLSIRARRILAQEKITTLEQLCTLTVDDLLRIKSIAVMTIVEIRKYVRDKGMTLKGESVV